jgi:hypothetical protein
LVKTAEKRNVNNFKKGLNVWWDLKKLTYLFDVYLLSVDFGDCKSCKAIHSTTTEVICSEHLVKTFNQ